MRARSKKVGIIGIVVATLLVAIMIVVCVLCSVYSSLIALYFRGSTGNATDKQTALKTANAFTEKQVSNGVVLLKNENDVLPLGSNVKTVNMFGALSAKQIYMGTGSAGGFNWSADDFLNFKTAFGEKGITVNADLWNYYTNLTGNASGVAGSVTNMQGSTHSIIDVPLSSAGYQDALDKAKQANDDVAIIVVGRAGGEGSDAVMEMNPYTQGSTAYNQNGDAGKHYLELMQVELDLVDYVKANYKNVILLVNSPMPIELGFVDGSNTGANTVGDIDAVMWMGLPGSTGNRGVVNVLTGAESPSGRLPDTWAYEMESAPSYYNFGDYGYLDENGDYISEAPGNNRKTGGKYVHYKESIYIGYRWYETANAEGVKVENVGNFQYNNATYETDDRKFGRSGGNIIGAEQKTFDFADYDSIVQYPFGYGLTYADFDIAFDGTPEYDSSSNEFVFNVKVTNTSTKNVTAKTPVLLYVEQPYIEAEDIEKSKVVLAQFEKTADIAAGGSEVLTLRVNRDEIASYDYKTEKAYVLSAGEYKFYADWGKYGSHCWAHTDDSDVAAWTYTLGEKIVFKGDKKRDSDKKAATNQFEDVNAGDGLYKPADDDLTRADFAGTFPKSYGEGTAVENNKIDTQGKTSDFYKRLMNASILQGLDPVTLKYTGEFSDGNGNYKDPSTGTAIAYAKNGLAVSDLTGKEYSDADWDKLLAQMSFADLEKLIGWCGWSNPAIMSISKTAAVDMDGCHGLHDLVTGVEANCYATTPITSATFDKKLAYEFGQTYGDECILNGVSGMYGFSMNMHRSPFGGRAFEYYSEDGFVAGTMAAAATGGLQSKGVAVYSKHFAVNDQETNRNIARSWLSEQALRELYLRPFEIVTKTADTASDVLKGGTGFMTGMNFLGTGHCSAHYSLLTELPRNEWGFQGRIVTDAEGFVSMSSAVRAGTDMILIPFAAKFDNVTGMDNSKGYGLAEIQEAAKHQLFVFANTAGVGLETGLSNAWVALPVVISIVLVAGAACSVAFMVVPAFFIKKKEQK